MKQAKSATSHNILWNPHNRCFSFGLPLKPQTGISSETDTRTQKQRPGLSQNVAPGNDWFPLFSFGFLWFPLATRSRNRFGCGFPAGYYTSTNRFLLDFLKRRDPTDLGQLLGEESLHALCALRAPFSLPCGGPSLLALAAPRVAPVASWHFPGAWRRRTRRPWRRRCS